MLAVMLTQFWRRFFVFCPSLFLAGRPSRPGTGAALVEFGVYLHCCPWPKRTPSPHRVKPPSKMRLKQVFPALAAHLRVAAQEEQWAGRRAGQARTDITSDAAVSAAIQNNPLVAPPGAAEQSTVTLSPARLVRTALLFPPGNLKNKIQWPVLAR